VKGRKVRELSGKEMGLGLSIANDLIEAYDVKAVLLPARNPTYSGLELFTNKWIVLISKTG
jgi:hypothetical protein